MAHILHPKKWKKKSLEQTAKHLTKGTSAHQPELHLKAQDSVVSVNLECEGRKKEDKKKGLCRRGGTNERGVGSEKIS